MVEPSRFEEIELVSKGGVAGAAIGLLSISTLALLFFTVGPELPIGLPTSPGQPPKQAVEITIIGGEISATKFGFALEGQNLTTPGPTIKVKVGDTVKITFKNVGGAQDQPHSFVVVLDGDRIVFGEKSRIGTRADPIDVKKSGTTTFKVEQPEEFFYICEVPGHRRLGMWGKFVVEAAAR